MPWIFDNPVDKLLEGYCRFKAAFGANPTPEDSWHKSMAATVLNAGKVVNQIPDQAEMLINIRYVRPEEKEQIIALAKEKSGLEVTVLESCLPVALDRDQPELQLMGKAIEKHYGTYPAFDRMNGATDARCFAACGKPIAIYGINGFGCHSKIEKIEVASIAKTAHVLLDLEKSL